MRSIVALNTQRIVLILAIALVVAVPAIATFNSRRATHRDGRVEPSAYLTLSRIAITNPNLPDGLEIPGRGRVKDLRRLGYSEDEIDQMWQSFQDDPSAHLAGSNSLPGWSQWQNPYGAIFP